MQKKNGTVVSRKKSEKRKVFLFIFSAQKHIHTFTYSHKHRRKVHTKNARQRRKEKMLGQILWLQKVRKQSTTEGIGLTLVGAQTSHP